jgi:hypothetical protein
MSFLSVLPAAEVFAGNAATLARPLLGLSAVVAFLLVFKPLLLGLARAALLVLRPRQSREERAARSRVRTIAKLNSMARRFDASEPGLANELRGLACRG